jgi:hypothetical protein
MISAQQPFYLALIRQFFPPGTLWDVQPQFSQWTYGGGFPNVDLSSRRKGKPARLNPLGTVDCNVTFDQFAVKEAVQVPLRPGAWTIAPGRRVVIHQLTPQQNGVSLDLEEISAAPLLSREKYLSGSGSGGPLRSFNTYVLYHPDWGEAVVLENNGSYSSIPDVLNGETRQGMTYVLPYPLLQERLAGLSLQDFLAKARLYVFTPQYEGTLRQQLQDTNFDVAKAGAADATATATDDAKNLEIIGQTVLPTNPTAAQMADYVDTIFWHLPDHAPEAQRRSIQRKLEAAGARVIPLLLDRLPQDFWTEYYYVFPVLTKLATRDQLPELQAALERDLQLADWFHEMKWDDDARDILVSKLGDHRVAFSAMALKIAAQARNPATYADLTWHFVRLGDQQSEVADALAQCPGFDLAGAVREAWNRVRLQLAQPGELPLLAARQGLPDAFNRAVMDLEQSSASAIHRQNQAEQLAALTDFSGAAGEATNWLSANLGQFHYDAASHRYLTASP